MTDPYSLFYYQSLVLRQCNICGALVNNERMHTAWHPEETDPEVEESAVSPWDEAVAAHLAPIEGDSAPADWTRHLTTAVVLLMYALQCDDAGDDDTRRVHVAHAAARIHVMAPEGTKWNEPIPLVPGGERPRLRSVVRALLEADASHRHQNEGSVTYRLVSAEASLHGLWLAADKEE
jgi:hypothetical protein